jgi:P4 family phage/plasmid primase-like protien
MDTRMKRALMFDTKGAEPLKSVRVEGRKPKQKYTQYDLRDLVIVKAEADGKPLAYSGGNWRRYDKGLWHEVDDLEVRWLISKKIEEAAKYNQVSPSVGLERSVADAIRTRVRKEISVWDSDPDLLVFANEALRISTRQQLDHSPEHNATVGLPYAFDPEAAAPTWERFLRETLQPDVVTFLQEFAGYCLTTDTRYEKALWLVGERGSGKSTFLEGLQAALGPLAGTLSLNELERSRFALARIPGMRLLAATEQPAIYVKCSHVLNALISGEPVTVEQKYSSAYEYRSPAKLLWAMNTPPRVPDPEDGLFRRVNVVHFPPRQGEKNPAVKERIRKEGPGILNWMLDGYDTLTKRGHFEVPESVASATEEFKSTNDVAGLFLNDPEAVTLGDEHRTKPSTLYGAYVCWAKDSGFKGIKNIRNISDDWKRHGLRRVTVRGQGYWKGVKVNTKEPGSSTPYGSY